VRGGEGRGWREGGERERQRRKERETETKRERDRDEKRERDVVQVSEGQQERDEERKSAISIYQFHSMNPFLPAAVRMSCILQWAL
jgi:hypothetical protein